MTVIPGRMVDRLVIFLDKQIFRLAEHWLLAVNLIMAVYAGLPFLAPYLMANGLNPPARAIYALYSPFCHQLPSRSFFLFGPQMVYSFDALWDTRAFIGNESMGYKMAHCQRDTAIYTSILLAGIAFGLVRHRLKPLSWKVYLLLVAPMAVDGFTQLIGLHQSNWLWRTITGALFGLASVWLIYPYLEEGMKDVRRTAKERLRWE